MSSMLSPTNGNIDTLPQANGALSQRIRTIAGEHKVRMDHSRLTPLLVVDAVTEFRLTGRVHDAFDPEALEAFAEIATIRQQVQLRLLSTKPVSPEPIPSQRNTDRAPTNSTRQAVSDCIDN